MIPSNTSIHSRWLGRQDYTPTWQAMREFTHTRTATTPDEFWLLEHPPVYTLGQAGRPEHILAAGDIPIVYSDRGGQVTYHGPGQLILYCLLDLRRQRLGIKALVSLLEQTVIDTLASVGIAAYADPKAPGVYVAGRKLAALGLRVSHGCSYHGLALNVANDLTPFAGINPCGYAGLRPTSLAELGLDWRLRDTGEHLSNLLAQHLDRSVKTAPT